MIVLSWEQKTSTVHFFINKAITWMKMIELEYVKIVPRKIYITGRKSKFYYYNINYVNKLILPKATCWNYYWELYCSLQVWMKYLPVSVSKTSVQVNFVLNWLIWQTLVVGK